MTQNIINRPACAPCQKQQPCAASSAVMLLGLQLHRRPRPLIASEIRFVWMSCSAGRQLQDAVREAMREEKQNTPGPW